LPFPADFMDELYPNITFNEDCVFEANFGEKNFAYDPSIHE